MFLLFLCSISTENMAGVNVTSLPLQTILHEQRITEIELIHQRMSRMCHNMPDTLYMVSPSHKKNVAAASSTQFTASINSSAASLQPALPLALLNRGKDSGQRRRSMTCAAG